MTLEDRIRTRAYFHYANRTGRNSDDATDNWLEAEREEQQCAETQIAASNCGGYRFRLTFHHGSPGFFQCADSALSYQIQDGPELTLVARDAEHLSKATRFHLDAYGFPDETTARSAGEHLRLRLQVVNSLLGLGFTIPTVDGTSGSFAADVKAKALSEDNTVIVDPIVGLAVLPDDGRHVELVTSITAENHPSDPDYLLHMLERAWYHSIVLDDKSNVALEIVGRATAETSARTKFLLIYLACGHLIGRPARSAQANAVVDELLARVCDAGLDPREAQSLQSALSSLKEQSFSSALTQYVERIQNPTEVAGLSLRKFLSKCISARHGIAHSASTASAKDLEELTTGLRHFVMMLIWTRNQIPNITLNHPTSAISILLADLLSGHSSANDSVRALLAPDGLVFYWIRAQRQPWIAVGTGLSI